MEKPTFQQWYLIENDKDYRKAVNRYEHIRESKRRSEEHKEKMLLVHLINKYENTKWRPFEMDPVEIIKIRMEDLVTNQLTWQKNMEIKEL